jgi:hypothetical protein
VRRLQPALVAGVLAAVGVVVLGVGIAQRTIWLPDDEVTATARVSGAAPVTVTDPGVLELRDGPVVVTARSGGDAPVLLAVGREADVEAWVGKAAHTVLTGLATETTLAARPAEGEPTVPNPAGSDLWVQRETGTGVTSLIYDRKDGRWLLLAATDGKAAAPSEISMTWPREVSTPWSTPLVVAGILALLAAAAVLAYLWWSDLPPFAPAGRHAGPRPSSEHEDERS